MKAEERNLCRKVYAKKKSKSGFCRKKIWRKRSEGGRWDCVVFKGVQSQRRAGAREEIGDWGTYCFGAVKQGWMVRKAKDEKIERRFFLPRKRRRPKGRIKRLYGSNSNTGRLLGGSWGRWVGACKNPTEQTSASSGKSLWGGEEV